MTFDLQERADALSGADLDVSLLASAQYFRQVAWTEPCPSEEHDALLQQVIRGNVERVQARPNQAVLSLAQQARERLVEVYQSLVISMARRRKFLFQSMELIDVIQEGNIGLLRALDKYTDEVSHVYAFRVFAALHIRTALSEASCDRDVSIRLPFDKSRLLHRTPAVMRELRVLLGRQPSLAEIAKIMGVSEEELAEVIEAGKRQAVKSVQELLEQKEISEDARDFVLLYASSVVSEDARQAELAETFERVFAAAMPEHQRTILELRFGFGDVPSEMRSRALIEEMTGVCGAATQEKKAMKRLAALLEPVVLADGRLSCTFDDVYTDDYCTSREAAVLLGIDVSLVNRYTGQGLLPSAMRPRRHLPGAQERVYKKADVFAFQEQRSAAPVKVAARRKNETLAAARRSASLPSVVA